MRVTLREFDVGRVTKHLLQFSMPIDRMSLSTLVESRR